jgi:lipopolysaccharide export system protein LptA
MRYRYIAFALFILIFAPHPVWAKAVAKIAVLPFEVNSPANPDLLKNEVMKKIADQVIKDKAILLIDRRTLSNALLELQVSSYTDETLRKVAEKTEANFILFGSLTQFNRSFSLDYYLFNNFEDVSFSKDFVEGADIGGLAVELVKKVTKEIQDLAEDIPPSQAPTETETEAGMKEETLRESPFPSPSAEETPEERVLTEIPSPSAPEEKPAEMVTASIPKEMAKGEVQGKQPGKKGGMGTLGQFQPSDKPVHITADSLEADNTQNMAVFKGNVVARQEDMVMFSDSMTVNYDEKGGMKQITASGNVKITRGDRVATGQKVVFYNPEQKIVLTGNPRVWQGADLISGERITIFVQENRSIVEGSKDKRVSATIYPKTKEEEKR